MQSDCKSKIWLKYLPTTVMVADSLTKNFPIQKIKNHLKTMFGNKSEITSITAYKPLRIGSRPPRSHRTGEGSGIGLTQSQARLAGQRYCNFCTCSKATVYGGIHWHVAFVTYNFAVQHHCVTGGGQEKKGTEQLDPPHFS
ncbi:hypothetical protein O181_023215 [Austropuccinia psidii MF-1]|uniref:Uncharacterized protein n=1 Tax=Austropuccinia psidii MF-1 TaxID=1389203 RepID=A0A9Q3CI29_9BASI|nr:hypothetical protein [Austropuccinia psidii MF-1]